jgi:phosphoglycerate dehydrogenase-like enzyme
MTLLVIADPGAPYLQLLKRLPADVKVLVGSDPAFLRDAAADADVLLSDITGGSLEPVFTHAKNVRWVHSLAAGVDKILFPALIESPVPLTNSRGVFKDALAEFVVAAVLFFAKDLRRLVRQQEARVWEQFDIPMIRGQVLGIIGYGEIGRATAILAAALGMRVISVGRRDAYSRERLHQMLAECDYVVLSAPLTPATRGMIGAAELRAMKSTAVLINIGRGPLVVEADLIEALKTHLRGAALDVYDREPLPPDHPYFSMGNVLLSPHSADHAIGWTEWSMLKFLENFERFHSGRELLNVVDKRAGY